MQSKLFIAAAVAIFSILPCFALPNTEKGLPPVVAQVVSDKPIGFDEPEFYVTAESDDLLVDKAHRLTMCEKKLASLRLILEAQCDLNDEVAKRIGELERKVSGMQEQITRLHAIREDLQKRVELLEKKVVK